MTMPAEHNHTLAKVCADDEDGTVLYWKCAECPYTLTEAEMAKRYFAERVLRVQLDAAETLGVEIVPAPVEGEYEQIVSEASPLHMNAGDRVTLSFTVTDGVPGPLYARDVVPAPVEGEYQVEGPGILNTGDTIMVSFPADGPPVFGEDRTARDQAG